MVGLDKSFDKLIQSDDGSIVTKVNLDHKSDFGIMKNEGNEFFLSEYLRVIGLMEEEK